MGENQELLQEARVEVGKPTSKRFFNQQVKNEQRNTVKGLGSAPDFGIIFDKTLFDFLHVVRKETDLIPKGGIAATPKGQRGGKLTDVRRELRDRTEEFMQDMRSIEMEDTIFPDVKPQLPDLVKNVDGVLVWTSGYENYQLAKIEKSKIQKLLRDSVSDPKNDVIREPLISRNKEKEVSTVLHQFATEHPDSEITVIIYDDSQDKFEKSDATIQEFEKGSGRQVNRLYAWAKTGRVGDTLNAEREPGIISALPANVKDHLRPVSSFADFVEIVKQYRAQTSDSVLVLLDFDGALSDNRIMRLRQSKVFHKHLRKIIQDLVLPENSRDQLEEIEVRLSNLLAEAA